MTDVVRSEPRGRTRIASRARIASCALVVVLVASAAGCKKRPPEEGTTAGEAGASAPRPVASAAAPAESAPPRPGMVWIPAGTLLAGTPVDRAPRVADEEMPGEAIPMQGFYIDTYPYPNEPGAIPTTNVTQADAIQLCAQKGKRLCTELEWERACKGPSNTTYEYGDAYRAASCGTGIDPVEAARRPTAEHPQCKSGFGVADMHGGVWQWTKSSWGRGGAHPDLGVLRGGNAVVGELVGRCANAIGRSATKKTATMGLRCCAGEANEVEVKLAPKGVPGLGGERLDGAASSLARALGEEMVPLRAYGWRPTANEELAIVVGCKKHGGSQGCAVVVGRLGARGDAGAPSPLLRSEMGLLLPDVARVGDPKQLRIRGLDARGTFGRELTYVYGRVELGDVRRP